MNPLAHGSEFLFPLLSQCGIGEDGGDYRRAVRRRIAVVRANANAQLRKGALRGFGIAGNDSQSADALTVEAKVL